MLARTHQKAMKSGMITNGQIQCDAEKLARGQNQPGAPMLMKQKIVEMAEFGEGFSTMH